MKDADRRHEHEDFDAQRQYLGDMDCAAAVRLSICSRVKSRSPRRCSSRRIERRKERSRRCAATHPHARADSRKSRTCRSSRCPACAPMPAAQRRIRLRAPERLLVAMRVQERLAARLGFEPSSVQQLGKRRGLRRETRRAHLAEGCRSSSRNTERQPGSSTTTGTP